MPLSLLVELVLALTISIPVVLVLRRVGWPSAAGFLLVGAALGDHALGWVRGGTQVESLAEIGVALLLFTAGLEFSLTRLRSLFSSVARIGVVMFATLVAASVGLFARKLGFETALFLGLAAALSSTALGLKLLADENELATPHGRLTVGVLLLQDVAVIPLLLAVPLLAGIDGQGLTHTLHVSGKALLLVAGTLAFGRFGFPRLAASVVRAGGRELFVLLVVCLAFGASLLAHELGLPLALGAFVAGLAIAETQFRHQTLSEILPFRDAFGGLFFLSMGMLFDVGLLVEAPLTIAALLAFLLVVKGGATAAAAYWVSRSKRTALLVGATLMQVGEFSFVLASEAVSVGLLTPVDFQLLLVVAVLSMLVTPLPRRLLASWGQLARTAGLAQESADETEHPDVLIAGYGFAGKQLAFALEALGIAYHVIEMNPTTVRRGRAEGVPISFGDIGRADVMLASGLVESRIFVLAISDLAATRRGIALAHRLAPSTKIVARTRYVADAHEFRALGADLVQPEEFATTLALLQHVLAAADARPADIERLLTDQRAAGARVLGSLDPGESHGNRTAA
ncbi:MAG: cation:proton antiporter [Planctomycetota bacterium]